MALCTVCTSVSLKSVESKSISRLTCSHRLTGYLWGFHSLTPLTNWNDQHSCENNCTKSLNYEPDRPRSKFTLAMPKTCLLSPFLSSPSPSKLVLDNFRLLITNYIPYMKCCKCFKEPLDSAFRDALPM